MMETCIRKEWNLIAVECNENGKHRRKDRLSFEVFVQNGRSRLVGRLIKSESFHPLFSFQKTTFKSSGSSLIIANSIENQVIFNIFFSQRSVWFVAQVLYKKFKLNIYYYIKNVQVNKIMDLLPQCRRAIKGNVNGKPRLRNDQQLWRMFGLLNRHDWVLARVQAYRLQWDLFGHQDKHRVASETNIDPALDW